MLRKTILTVIWIFVTLNIILGLLGISSILLTVSVYFSVWLVVKMLIDRFFIKTDQNKNYQLLLATIIISLFLTEVALKYVAKANLTYSEKNGDFFYNSMYKQRILENFGRRYILRQNDIQISTHPANSIDYLRKPEFAYTHTFNSLGLRDKEPILDTSIVTIIGLGDSFTEGVGSPQDSTWLKLLEGNIKRLYPNKKMQTLNAGVNGSDPIAEYLLLERQLIRYNPKIVIVCINNSDISDVIVRGGNERFTNGTVKYSDGPWWEFFYSYSYIFRSIIHSFFNLNYLLLTDKQNEIENKIAIEKLKESINTEYKNLAKKYSFKLVVVLHPMQWELEQKKFMLKDLSSEFKKDTSILTINLYNEYYGFQKNSQYNFNDLYWQTDLHHNSTGYMLWADILTHKISPLLE
ncbi:MAG TPA: hypothetical protein PLS84_11770 [Salinivirgaceae bacterium]|nr:hypothetical protein [Salinivirgaceae bacterium]